MSYSTPTFEEVWSRVRNRMRAELPGTDADIFPSTNYVIAKTVAGEVWELFQYLDWIKRQRFATEADGDQLDEVGKPYGITRKAASVARGQVTISGTPLTTIADGTVFVRSDQVEFKVLDDVTIQASGTLVTDVEAVVSGKSGNTIGGSSLTPQVFNAAITSVFVTSDGLGGGAALESDESLRARILMRMRNPPQGGAAHDYVFWALNIAGVTRVWVDPLAYGPGTVGVWFMADDTTSTGIPGATLVGDVQSYIDTLRPATARVFVKAPIAATINVVISGITPSETQQAAINAEIKDVFRRVVQVSVPNAAYVLSNNTIWQAVARATGSSSHQITLPRETTSIPVGYIPVLGDIAYVA